MISKIINMKETPRYGKSATEGIVMKDELVIRMANIKGKLEELKFDSEDSYGAIKRDYHIEILRRRLTSDKGLYAVILGMCYDQCRKNFKASFKRMRKLRVLEEL